MELEGERKGVHDDTCVGFAFEFGFYDVSIGFWLIYEAVGYAMRCDAMQCNDRPTMIYPTSLCPRSSHPPCSLSERPVPAPDAQPINPFLNKTPTTAKCVPRCTPGPPISFVQTASPDKILPVALQMGAI